MTKIHAIGQARFHFWGDYHETLVLGFKTAEEATQAVSRLNITSTFLEAEWKQGEKDPRGIHIFVSGDDVERAHSQLKKYGADPKKISSIKRSIDHGEIFDIWIDIEDSTPPSHVQQELKLA